MILDEYKNAILGRFNKNFPDEMKISIENNQLNIFDNHKIYQELIDFASNKSSSLPFIGNNKVSWITIAPSLEDLREMRENLLHWVIPSFAWEEENSIVTSENADGEFANNIIKISPFGYFKWTCHIKDFETIIDKLKKMRFVNGMTPPKSSYTSNNISFYREQFALAISVGDKETAFSSIYEINNKQLDLARNTLFMEIRALEIFKNYNEIVTHSKLNELLSISLPLKISMGILKSFHEIYLYELERQKKYNLVLEEFKKFELHNLLISLLNKNVIKNDFIFARMSCYEMLINNRIENYNYILNFFPRDDVLNFYKNTFEKKLISNNFDNISIKEVDQFDTKENHWENLINFFKSKDERNIIKFHQNLSKNYENESYKIRNENILLELFTDNEITNDKNLKEELDNILYTVIDLYICDPSFPKNDNEELYNIILDIWILKHNGSTQTNHTQLFLIIIETILTINLNKKLDIIKRINNWWNQRPVKAALDWLGSAIEIYYDQTGDNSIISLWYDGINFINGDIDSFDRSELNLWTRLGKRLGVDDVFLNTNLNKEFNEDFDKDILKQVSFKKIVIVSLQENSARSASLEIKERTGADVIIINKNAAGDLTESAKSADVILYVWASAKHSIYRAFDNNRELLQYVQGTGSASILRALESWVVKKIEIND
jgi:hypothetical protein